MADVECPFTDVVAEQAGADLVNMAGTANFTLMKAPST